MLKGSNNRPSTRPLQPVIKSWVRTKKEHNILIRTDGVCPCSSNFYLAFGPWSPSGHCWFVYRPNSNNSPWSCPCCGLVILDEAPLIQVSFGNDQAAECRSKSDSALRSSLCRDLILLRQAVFLASHICLPASDGSRSVDDCYIFLQSEKRLILASPTAHWHPIALPILQGLAIMPVCVFCISAKLECCCNRDNSFCWPHKLGNLGFVGVATFCRKCFSPVAAEEGFSGTLHEPQGSCQLTWFSPSSIDHKWFRT